MHQLNRFQETNASESFHPISINYETQRLFYRFLLSEAEHYVFDIFGSTGRALFIELKLNMQIEWAWISVIVRLMFRALHIIYLICAVYVQQMINFY